MVSETTIYCIWKWKNDYFFLLLNMLYIQTIRKFVKVNTDQVSLSFNFGISKGTSTRHVT